MPNLTDGMTQDLTVDRDNGDLPDLSSILAEIDFDRKPISHGSAALRGDFNVGKWGSLIIELLAYPEQEAAILAEYGLTPYQYETLRGNKLFKEVYREVESSLSALAGTNGFQLQARRVAEQGLTRLEHMINHGEDKDALKAIELSANLANLNPALIAKTKQENATINTGVQLVVNFGNGLRKPEAFNGTNTVIDVNPEDIDEVK